MAKHAGVSDDAVKRATGRDWAEWIAALDRENASTRSHRDITLLLHDELGVQSGWWSQMIGVGYEQAKGLRDVHQKPDGYVAGASRTFPVPADVVYAAWTDAGRRRRWLHEPIDIGKATPAKSVRIAWPDGSRVDVYLTSKEASKTQVAIQHSKLADENAVAMRKAFWREALDRLGGDAVAPGNHVASHARLRLLAQILRQVVDRASGLARRSRALPAAERLVARPRAGGCALRTVRIARRPPRSRRRTARSRPARRRTRPSARSRRRSRARTPRRSVATGATSTNGANISSRPQRMIMRRARDGRRHEVAMRRLAMIEPLAALDDRRPPHRARDLRDGILVTRDRRAVDHRPHPVLATRRIAHGDLECRLVQRGDEIREHRVLDVDARARRALLAGKTERRAHDAGRGVREVRVARHDRRILAAHFGDARRRPGALRETPVDVHAHVEASGERRTCECRVVDQRLSDARARPGDVVEHAIAARRRRASPRQAAARSTASPSPP